MAKNVIYAYKGETFDNLVDVRNYVYETDHFIFPEVPAQMDEEDPFDWYSHRVKPFLSQYGIALTVADIPDLQPTDEQLADEVRAERDFYLSSSDKYMLSDFPISSEDLNKVIAYRTALRNVPQQSGFPKNVVWPEFPKLSENK